MKWLLRLWLLAMGLVFLSAEDAIANANAMCMIGPGRVP